MDRPDWASVEQEYSKACSCREVVEFTFRKSGVCLQVDVGSASADRRLHDLELQAREAERRTQHAEAKLAAAERRCSDMEAHQRAAEVMGCCCSTSGQLRSQLGCTARQSTSDHAC